MNDLRTPRTLPENTLRITPLGGLGDVGRNMATFELEGRLAIIDCGVLFPEEHHPGVDLILPALEHVTSRINDVEALVLTHGHEDHIGAVPFLLKHRPDLPVYGSKLTCAFVENKLKEHRIRGAQLNVIKEGDVVSAGSFEFEFVAVNHSIPDAMAVFIRTKAGNVLHTGDFKMDQLPLDGRITDLRSFARLADEGVDLFMVDSTNAVVPGFTTPERDVVPALERVFDSAPQKIVVTCFASHIHRVQQILNLTVKHGRKAVFMGRSMVRNMSVARDLGYLKIPADVLVELNDIHNIPDDRLVIISTGSQGEPMAALSRMAHNDHRHVDLKPGDVVLLASSMIPGNENAVYRVINALAKLGTKVVHQGNALVHVSGHASAGELLYCHNLIRPKNVMPVHGELRHLMANAALAIETGVPAKRVAVCTDGDVVDLANGEARKVGRVDASYIFVDGSTVGDISDSLTDRRILGEEGFVSIVTAVSLHAKEIVSGPDIHARGLAVEDSAFDEAREQVAKVLTEALSNGETDRYQLQKLCRRALGQFVSKKLRRRPMIVPVVVTT